MKIHRFFIESKIPQEGEFSITNEGLLNQWRNVLRFVVGDQVILFDGRGNDVMCKFVLLEKRNAVFVVVERTPGLMPPRSATLYMALIKKDNLELVFEKATELGVSRVIPVVCARSEKKGVNRERSEKILREASEQSGRTTIPILGEVIDIKDAQAEGLVVLDPRGELSAREFFAAHAATPVSVLIGPEGGFTDNEIESFHARNIPIVSTGTQILRAETAAIVALTLVLVQ